MAENKGFDLSALLQSVPYQDTDKQMIEYIPLDLIDPDPENFYSIDGLDELAGSIELLGLQQPLVLRPAQGGRYTVISGHRRRAAIMLIRDGGSDQFAEGVPSIIDRSEASAALQKLKLLMANKDTRKMTSADENRQAEELENVLRELEDAGMEFPGRLRDWVSKLSGMSRSKLARLKVIREKLHPDLLNDYYYKGRMNESVAYAFAQQPQDVQEAIVQDRFRRRLDISGMQADDVQEFLDRKNRPAPVETSERGKSERDSAVDNIYKIRENMKFYQELTDPDFFRKITKRLPAGADRKTGIGNLKLHFGSCYAGGTTNTGIYDCSPKGLRLGKITRTWAEVYDMIATRAIFLAQSGVQPKDAAPAVEWQTGKPKTAGVYAVRFKVSETAPGELHSFARWDGFQWKAVRSGKVIDDMIAVGWYQIPEV